MSNYGGVGSGSGSGSGSRPGKRRSVASTNVGSARIPSFSDDYVPDDVGVENVEELFEAAERRARQAEEAGPSGPSTTAGGGDGGGVQRALTSEIFARHYKKEAWDGPGGGPNTFRCTCNHCPVGNKAVYKYQKGDGYGTLRRHVQKHHPGEWGIQTSQTQLRTGTQTGGRGNSSLFHYSDASYRRYLAEFIAADSLPFRFSDSRFYEEFAQMSLNPAARRVPRTSLTREITKAVGERKLKLREMLGSLPQRVSICCDVWSDHWQENHYMGITCHWVDSAFLLQKRLIAYSAFNEVHTATNIARLITYVLNEYNICQKNFSISFDNASSNTASLSDLISVCKPHCGGRLFHIRCICHVLNICVQTGLKVLKHEFAPIREAVQYLHRHPKELKKWGRHCRKNGMKAKKFSPDVPTRWNSTYQMLSKTSEYRTLLTSFFLENRDAGIMINESNWDSCQGITDFLEVFKEVTEDLSGVYYPTAHLVVSRCVAIIWAFRDLLNSDPTKMDLVFEMLSKWLKYYFFIPDSFLIAALLDPTLRDSGLTEMLSTYYEIMYELPVEYIVPVSERPNPRLLVEQAKILLKDLFRETAIQMGERPESFESTPSQSSLQASRSHDKGKKLKSWLKSFDPYKSSEGGSRSRTSPGSGYAELEFYFTQEPMLKVARPPTPPLTFDVLDWWSKMVTVYPTITLLAKEVLAVPASTVSVEQAFSNGGYTLNPRRSRTTPAHLEEQLLLSDWKKAEAREQTLMGGAEDSDSPDDMTNTTCSTVESQAGEYVNLDEDEGDMDE